MKKYMISTLAMAMTLAMTTTTFATSPTKPTTSESYDTVTVTVTDEETNETVELVSIREYAQAMSYKVAWDGKTQTITFTKGENTFVATIGSNEYYADVKGSEPKTVELEAAPVLIDGKTYAPNSFVKMLRDVPVVDPVAPGRDLGQYQTITPTVPTTDGRDLGKYTTITPTVPTLDGRDLSQFTTITPEIDVILNDLSQYDTLTPSVTPLMDLEMAKIIGGQMVEEMDALTEEVTLAIEEDKAEFIANGGDIDEYVAPTFKVGYEIYSRTNDYIKVRFFVESSLDSLDREYPLTYDTNTGEIIKLER